MPSHIMECHRTTWGVRPEVFPLIAAVMAGRLDTLSEQQRQALTTMAAARSQRVTGGVAILSLTGLITPYPSFLSLLFGGGGGLQQFRSELREAVASEEVAAIVLDVDSPGGSTDLVTETAAEVRAARGPKPIVAIANTLAASAAYWIAAQADELVVTPSGEVGSIGVFAIHDDWSGFNEQMGIKPTYISAGRFKTEANPDEPLTDEARDAIQQTVDTYYEMFVDDVAQGRGTTASAVRDGFGEGRVVTAQRAVELGMANRVATFESTVVGLVGSPAGGANALAGLRADEQPTLSADEAETTSPPRTDGDTEQSPRVAELLLRSTN